MKKIKTIIGLVSPLLLALCLLSSCKEAVTAPQSPQQSGPSAEQSLLATPTPTPTPPQTPSKDESSPSKEECVHEEVIDPAVEPTCTERGMSEGAHCKKCGKVLKRQTPLGAKGHKVVIDRAVAPTCSKEGQTEGKHCSVCEQVLIWPQPVSMLPHHFKNDACTVCGAPKASEGLWMELSNDGSYYYVSDLGTCTDKDVIVPAIYGGLPVKEVWYIGGQVESVVIPDSVTVLHARAFSQNTALKSVTLGKGITVIEAFTFDGCTALEKVVFEGKVTEIKKSAFEGTAIKELHIGDIASFCGVRISADAGTPFHDGGVVLCHNGAPLTDLVIPEGVKTISTKAFMNCVSIKSISFPQSLTEIGDRAFEGCTALETLTIPGNVKLVKSAAFSGCTALRSVTLEDGVEDLYTRVFSGCTALESFTFPESFADSVGDGFFEGCTSLRLVTFSAHTPSIGTNAFKDCKSLVTVILPQSITTVRSGAFDGFEGQTFFCEATEKPADWDKSWMAGGLATVYWGDDWHYVDGKPTLK